MLLRCPACGGELRDWRTVPSSEPAVRAERFLLRRCVSCGSAVTEGPAPPDLHETGAYKAGQPRLYRAALLALSAFDRQRLSFVRELAQPGARLLDAGAGRGRFVAAAAAAGYEAHGIEPSLRGVQAAAAIGAPVERASIESGLDAFARDSVEVVTLWHVLEHLDAPGLALEQIRSWLVPGGGLVVGVPNLDSWQARLGGERWYHLDVPRHRVHFTARGLRTLLTDHGFAIARTVHLLLEHNPFGMWQSLVSHATSHPSYLYNLLKRNAPLRSPDLAVTAAALPLLPLAALLELIAGAAGRGGTIAVLARRSR